MNIVSFIAGRYLFAKRNFQFITIIGILSLIGITIGVAALIIIISIFNGFQQFTKEQFIGFDPHIQIKSKDGKFIEHDANLMNNLLKINEIKEISPDFEFKAIVSHKQQLQSVSIMSVDTNNLEFYKGIGSSVILGNFKFKNISDIPGIVLGSGIANQLDVFPGDSVSIISEDEIEDFITGFRLSSGMNFYVAGIFSSNIKNYDMTLGFIGSREASVILNPEPNQFSSINIRLNDINHLDKVVSDISKILPADMKIITWIDLNPDLFNVMKFERMSTFAVLSIIILLAVFNILISLTMTVVEKQKDIGILKSLGLDSTSIYKIFFNQGFFLGLIGSFSGAAIGLIFCYLQINYKLLRVDTTKYLIDSIPVLINYWDVIFIMIFSLVLTSLSSIYPASRASNTNISEAIRSE